jgi:hypothetical protein
MFSIENLVQVYREEDKLDELERKVIKSTSKMKNGCYKKYYDKEETILYIEEYYLNDKLHREDGPAKITYLDDGDIDSEEYYLNDKLHREEGPAYISYKNYKSGDIFFVCYYLRGKKYKEVPALVYFENGKPVVTSPLFKWFNMRHSKNGPFKVIYKSTLRKFNSLEEYSERVEDESKRFW